MQQVNDMKKKNNALLTGPYLIWTVAFIVIPLILIVYYGSQPDH